MVERQGKRACDLCGEPISEEQAYRQVRIPPEAAAVLVASEDLVLTPTMTQDPDGSIRLDLCLDCAMGIDTSQGTDRAH
ncbi:MAG: hypothetical protein ACE5I9_00765 [Candidatus Methylomirabilales bacterium]